MGVDTIGITSPVLLEDPRTRQEPFSRAPHRWAVVLAGGDGVRLRSVVREICGDDRPKQFAALLGPHCLLRQTLDRVRSLFPAERIVVVSQRRQARYLTPESLGAPPPVVLLQPSDRGTAAGILLPAHWIAARDPGAVIAVFPSDHFVLEDEAFMAHVASALSLAEQDPRVVLLGAEPSQADTEYGWIEPGDVLSTAPGGPVRTVRAFHEKPDADTARDAYRRGWLWNTFVFTARAASLIAMGAHAVPALHGLLATLAARARSVGDEQAIEDAYARATVCDFSRAVLAPTTAALAVSKLPPLTWSDLGTPERLFAVLRRLWAQPDATGARTAGVASLGVRARAIPGVLLWGWEIVDPVTGTALQSSWEHEWNGYRSAEDALEAGRRWLGQPPARPLPARAARETEPVPAARQAS